MRLAWTGRAPQMIEDMRAADVLIDVVFWGDVVLNFFTGYTDAGGLEMDAAPRGTSAHDARHRRRRLAVRLLLLDARRRGTIAPDATEAAANATASAAAQTDYVAVSVAVELLKLLKLLRLLRLPRIARRLDLIVGLQRSTSTIAKFLVGVFVVAHWWSCGWFALGWYAHVAAVPVGREGTAEPDVGVVEQARRAIPAQFCAIMAQFCAILLTRAVVEQYVSALFWAFTTFTVGIGDIVATNDAERIYCVVVMTVGTMVFTYGITSVVRRSRTATARRRSSTSSSTSSTPSWPTGAAAADAPRAARVLSDGAGQWRALARNCCAIL